MTFLAEGSPYNWAAVIDRFTIDPTSILQRIEAELNDDDFGRVNVPRNWRKRGPSKETASGFAQLMEGKSAAPAEAFAQMDLRALFGTKRLLDIGGGSGTYSEKVSKQQDIHCAVLELPAMAQCAREYCSDRVEIIEGDVFGQLPTGFDTHLLCDTLHMFGQEDAVTILKNCHAALPAGGTVILSNAMLDDSGSSPRNSVYFYVHMFITGAGRSYTPTQFKEVLTKAGFSKIEFRPYYAHYMLIIGVK